MEQAFKELKKFMTKNNLKYDEAINIFLEHVYVGMMVALGSDSKVRSEYRLYETDLVPLLASYVTHAQKNPFDDNLGELYERAVDEFGKPKNGQFFTPSCVSRLIASLIPLESDKESVSISDPCCGFGSLLLGYLEQHKDIDFEINIIANDLDINCCIATFIQLMIAQNFCIGRLNLKITQGDILIHPNGEKIVCIYEQGAA